MATKYYLSQRTGRHVIKRLDSTGTYDGTSFGTWGTAKIDNTGLNYPWSIAADGSNNIYVCDGNNKRIVKLTSGLVYSANVDVTNEIGVPTAIFYDSVNACLYVAGIYNNITFSIARITTALSVTKYNNNINPADINIVVTANPATDLITSAGHGLSTGDEIAFSFDAGGSLPSPLLTTNIYYVIWNSVNDFKVATTLENAQNNVFIDLTAAETGVVHVLRISPTAVPRGISRGFAADDFLISGTRNLLKVVESGVFSTATIQAISGESGIKFTGHIKHTNGNLYLNAQKMNYSLITKVNSSYVNVGDSDKISKVSSNIFEGYDTNIVLHDEANSQVLEYDANMNKVSLPYVYSNTGSTIGTDAQEIYGILKLNV